MNSNCKSQGDIFAFHDTTVVQEYLDFGMPVPAIGAEHPSSLITLWCDVWLNVKDTPGVTGQWVAPMIRFNLFCLMRPINNTLAFLFRKLPSMSNEVEKPIKNYPCTLNELLNLSKVIMNSVVQVTKQRSAQRRPSGSEPAGWHYPPLARQMLLVRKTTCSPSQKPAPGLRKFHQPRWRCG